MQFRSTFLLDTNVFIEPKNRFYPFDIVPGYWDLLEKELGGDSVQSIMKVYDETDEVIPDKNAKPSEDDAETSDSEDTEA